MAITASGIGSGLDISGIISQLMAVEQQPLTKLNTKEAGLQAKISALGTLKGALSQFQTSVKALTDPAKFNQITSSVSDETIATVSTTSNAPLGSFSLEVSQLAVAHKVKSGLFAKTSDAVGTGKISIQFGTYADGSFSVNPEKSAVTVTIDANKSTLSGVRDAINAANAGVTASIVNDGSGNRLVLSSKDTGVANTMKITVEDGDLGNTDTSGLSQLAYDPAASAGAGKNLTELQAAKNALMKIDGLDVSKASNTVSDAVDGVTLTLAKLTTTAVNVNVSRSTSTISTAVQAFVKSYNDLDANLKDLGHYSYNKDTKAKDVGALQGETALRSIQSQLRSVMSGMLGGGSYTRLSDVGISFNRDGTLALDSSKLNAAISKDYAGVASLFSANAVPTDSKVSYVSATAATKAGKYDINVTQLATKGTITGSALTLPYTNIAASNAAQAIVLGGSSASVSLTSGSYADSSALAAEIKSKIEANSTLSSAGDVFAVAYNGTSGKFDISRTRGNTTINAGNATQAITLGGASSSINLAINAYADTTALAAEIKSKIEADPVLFTAGDSVSVTYNSTSGQYDVSRTTGGTTDTMSLGFGTTTDTQNLSFTPKPFQVDANNDTFKLKVDGVQSDTITLSQGVYSGTSLAAELQSRINGDSLLKKGNVAVSVAWNATTNKLEFTSNRYGSASTLEVTSLDTNTGALLGVAAGKGTDGLDVAGTIGGESASGNGQALTGSQGDAIGLKLNIDGTTSGDRGSITFNRGFAYQLDKLLETMVSSTGAIASRVDGLNASIKTINSSRETLNLRIANTEARYRKQFTALDTLVGSMKQTSTYLATQLANL